MRWHPLRDKGEFNHFQCNLLLVSLAEGHLWPVGGANYRSYMAVRVAKWARV